MTGSNNIRRLWFLWLFVWVAVPMTIWALSGGSFLYFVYGDVLEYRSVFDGRWEDAHQPFTYRILTPVLGRWLNAGTDLSPWAALGVINLCFFVALLFFLNRLLIAMGATQLGLRFLVLSTPLFALWGRSVALPDIAYNALVAAGLLAFLKKRYPALVIVVFVMTLAKEMSLFFMVPAAILLLRAKPIISGLLVLSWICAFALVQWVSQDSAGNLHGVHPLLYPFVKIAYHSVGNLTGLQMAFPGHHGPEELLFKLNLSNIKGLGNIEWVGVSAWSGRQPSRVALGTFGSFGLFTFLPFFRSFWRQIADRPEHKTFFRLTIFYGIAMGATNLIGGVLVERVFGYAWPLFLLLGAYWVTKSGVRFRGYLLALHLLLTWGFHLYLFWLERTPPPEVVLIAYAPLVVLGFFAVRTALSRNPSKEPGS